MEGTVEYKGQAERARAAADARSRQPDRGGSALPLLAVIVLISLFSLWSVWSEVERLKCQEKLAIAEKTVAVVLRRCDHFGECQGPPPVENPRGAPVAEEAGATEKGEGSTLPPTPLVWGPDPWGYGDTWWGRAGIRIHQLASDQRQLALIAVMLLAGLPVLLFWNLDALAWPFTRGRGKGKRQGGAPAGGGVRQRLDDVPPSKRLAYRIDILFSKHEYMKPLALFLGTLALIGLGGLALFAVSELSIGDAYWKAWTYVADAGNHADSEGLAPRIVSVLISFGGLFVFALMLGLVADTISEKVDSLRKGKSDVIEAGHTLILGWNSKMASLLRQLAQANASLGGQPVVVLSGRSKEDMEAAIGSMEFDFQGTTVVCRSGSALSAADLRKVSVTTARSIIVLAELNNAAQSDARALRVVLGLVGLGEALAGHVVVELRDLDTEQLVRLVGGDQVVTLVAHDVIGRLMVQCARQPGVGQVWETVLGFENSEFYAKAWPELVGRTFGEALLRFPAAIPCGVRHVEGQITLNPADDYVLKDGDLLLVLAEDDDSYALGPSPQLMEDNFVSDLKPPPLKPEKVLVVGWRRDMDDMLQVLHTYLAPGSEVWLLNSVPPPEREARLAAEGLGPGQLEGLKLVHRVGSGGTRRHLEALPLEEFGATLIVADEATEDCVEDADACALSSLLLIRDIQATRVGLLSPSSHSWVAQLRGVSSHSPVVSEILDAATKSLLTVADISDTVLSNELVAMALAMVAEDRAINGVLAELFSKQGNSLSLQPMDLYSSAGEQVSFYDLMARGRRRSQVVIGYRPPGRALPIINPPSKGVAREWERGCSVVVLGCTQ